MPAGRPSREAIVLASMQRGRGRGGQMGDPFLGALLPALGGFFKPALGAALGAIIPRRPRAPDAIIEIPDIISPGRLEEARRGLLGIGGIAPRRRRMNVLNPRALRRSIRRVEGFARFARRTIRITQRVRLKKRTRRR